MRQLSAALTAVLAAGGPFVKADLFTITLTNGSVLRWWTGQNGSFTIGGNTYVKGPPITRDKAKWSMGLDVDQINIEIDDDGSATINGQSLVKSAWQNLFDLAQVEIDRFISSSWTNTSVGTVPWFTGTVGDISLTGKAIKLTVESPLTQFKATFPKTFVLPSCANTLYDGVCQLSQAAHTHPGTIGSSPSATSFPLTLSGGNLADGVFQNGRIQFTSGVNNGQVRSVKSYVGGIITLVYPLYVVPAAGDSVNAIEGCIKTRARCNALGNIAHYRGFPYVPDPSTQYSGAGSGAPESSTGTGGSSGGLTTRIGPRGRYGNIQQF